MLTVQKTTITLTKKKEEVRWKKEEIINDNVYAQ